MDQTQQESTFEESIKQVMQTLPPSIRHYLGQGKYSVVASNLMIKYSLHIDQGGILENSLVLLLRGVDNQDEFAAALKDEAKIPENIVSNIMTDVNAQIFVPLREEMRKGTAPVTQQQKQTPVEIRPPQAQPSAPRSGAPSQRPDLRSVLASVTKEVPKLLEDHEEPHINIGVRDKVQGASPPANLPGVIHHPPIIPPPPPPPAPTQPPPPTPPVPLKPKPIVPVAPYSSDPYREPIDEK